VKYAIYARKSTEQNGAEADAKSTERQIENAKKFGEERGWTVSEDHIYVDEAVSGAGTKRLVQRQRLLDEIQSGHAPFQVIVMRDASRFSRRDGDEAFGELKEIAKAGVEIWFYQDGTPFEYGNFAANITGIVRAEMNAEYRRQVSKWTSEAMVRKARAGYVTGGRVFGYDNVRVDGHVERRINEAEAAVVRRIYEMAAAGFGFKRIAKTLNDEGRPSPRPQRGRPAGWAPSSVRPILLRTLYKGVMTWGKTKARNDSGERRVRKRDTKEWLEIEVPRDRDLGESSNRGHRSPVPSVDRWAPMGPAGTGPWVQVPPDWLRRLRRLPRPIPPLRDDVPQLQDRPAARALLHVHRLPQQGQADLRQWPTPADAGGRRRRAGRPARLRAAPGDRGGRD